MDRQAEELFSQLVEQMAEREGVTEQLKAAHQMEWVGRMNNIRDRVTEIIHPAEERRKRHPSAFCVFQEKFNTG